MQKTITKIILLAVILFPVSLFAAPTPNLTLVGVQPFIELYDTYDKGNVADFIEQFGVLDINQNHNLVLESDGASYTRLVSPGYLQLDTGGTTRAIVDSFGINVTGNIRTSVLYKPTCNSALRGAMTYDSTNDHFFGCRSSGWVQLDN